MVEFGFWETLAIVIAPVITGAIATHYLTQGWQKYQLKIKLKQEVLELFLISGKRSYVIQDMFSRKLAQHYGRAELPMNKKTHDIIYLFDEFPKGESEQPAVVFKDEFENFHTELQEIRFNGENLISKLRLYYKNETLEVDYEKIRSQSGICAQQIRKSVNATTRDEFLVGINNFHEESKELINLIKNFEQEIIEEKITDINV